MPLAGASLDAVSLQLPEGIYTTLRTYEGSRLLGLTVHLKRLVESHSILQRQRPLDLDAIRLALRAIIAREALPTARLRITTPFDSELVYISIEPFEPFPESCYADGVRCATARLERQSPKAKYTGFIAPSRAIKAEADKQSAEIHELLRLGEDDHILEGISSNFFAVIEGNLRTAGEGVLEGVTRGVVLSEAPALLPVRLQAVPLADLPRVTECFITSSGREVMPVIRIDNHVIGAGRPGPITQELIKRYRAYLQKAAELP